ncbi:chemotaxis protein CheW [Tabrizicola sp. M-4]|uniref:chemotaxis protein CheW n=1 Tax=Tabrizicola sp. M-4 TaxID=3055847 RepID=UPI003DA96514
MTIHHLKEDRQLTVVTLSLGPQVLAIPAVRLREILDPLPVTRVPGAGPLVPGVVNVRGTVVPLANLKQVLRIPEVEADDRRRFLVLDVTIAGEAAVVAVEADAVHEVSTIETSIVEPVPAAASAWPPEFLTGLYRGADGFVLMPDLDHILSALVNRPLA